jgi:hypothetical protein
MEYDFVVIGGGSAGYAGARTAAALGLKVAVVEGGREVGGLCILRGCMPSKTLLESARRFRVLKQAGSSVWLATIPASMPLKSLPEKDGSLESLRITARANWNPGDSILSGACRIFGCPRGSHHERRRFPTDHPGQIVSHRYRIEDFHTACARLGQRWLPHE